MDIYTRLLQYLKPYRMRLVGAGFFMLLTSGLIASQTYLIKPILDKVLIGKNLELARLLPPALILVTLVKGLTWYVRDYFMGYVGQRIVNDIRDELYAHIQSLSFSFFTRTPTGVIISRIVNDVNMVQGAMTKAPASLVQGVMTMVTLIGYIFFLNWKLATFSVIVLPFAGIAFSRFGRRFRKTSTTMQEQIGLLTTHLHETITGIRIVKAFGMEDYEIKRFKKSNRDLFNSYMRIIKTTALSHPVMETLSMVGVALVITYAIYAVIAWNTLTVGEFFSFLGALIFFYRPLKDLNGINVVIQDGVAAARRIFDVLDTEPEIRDLPSAAIIPRGFRTIELRNVSFRYDEDLVLRDLSLTVHTGQTIAIVGKSGGGKTTLVNLFPRFYDVTGGAILIDGVDIRDATLGSLRANMAIVTQQTILFNDTVRNNIAYGHSEKTYDDIIRASRAAHAEEFIQSLPQGYDTVIGESGIKLSGGQRQRIAIARALLKDAPILILDEATSSLDTESEQEVQVALDELMKGRTSFVIAHRLSTIMNADRIIVLKDGRIVEEGRHSELLSLGGEYKNLYDRQFRDDPQGKP
jgi:subfamily B ATP-binding cassette protein MsbA